MSNEVNDTIIDRMAELVEAGVISTEDASDMLNRDMDEALAFVTKCERDIDNE